MIITNNVGAGLGPAKYTLSMYLNLSIYLHTYLSIYLSITVICLKYRTCNASSPATVYASNVLDQCKKKPVFVKYGVSLVPPYNFAVWIR